MLWVFIRGLIRFHSPASVAEHASNVKIFEPSLAKLNDAFTNGRVSAPNQFHVRGILIRLLLPLGLGILHSHPIAPSSNARLVGKSLAIASLGAGLLSSLINHLQSSSASRFTACAYGFLTSTSRAIGLSDSASRAAWTRYPLRPACRRARKPAHRLDVQGVRSTAPPTGSCGSRGRPQLPGAASACALKRPIRDGGHSIIRPLV